MPKGFLPNTDEGLLSWSKSFLQNIQSAPLEFGLTPDLAAQYATLHQNFATAFAACAPALRNQMATTGKNFAREALKSEARLLSRLVQGTASVTDSQKVLLGLNVRKPPTRIPAPTAAPGLKIVSVTGRRLEIKLFDQDVSGRSRPGGVAGASVFSFTGSEPPIDLQQWKLETSVTRTTATIVFPQSLPPGATVYLTACWFNPRSQRGPLCPAVTTTFGAADVVFPQLKKAA